MVPLKWSFKEKELLFLYFSASFLDVEFHPHGLVIGASSTEGTVKIFDLKTGFLQQCYDAHEGSVNKARFHPNGKFMITASEDGSMKVNTDKDILYIISFFFFFFFLINTNN